MQCSIVFWCVRALQLNLCNAGRTVQCAQGATTLKRHRKAENTSLTLWVFRRLEQTKNGCNNTKNTGSSWDDHWVGCAGRVAGACARGAGSVTRVSRTCACECSLDSLGAASFALELAASSRDITCGQQGESTADIGKGWEINTAMLSVLFEQSNMCSSTYVLNAPVKSRAPPTVARLWKPSIS